jgi:predicted ATPase/DNA-binding winged helix-turn-helix (wHTH) protein
MDVPQNSSFEMRTMPEVENLTEGHHPTPQSGGVIVFGDFRLVPAARTLTRGRSSIHLGARALDILIALVERAGQVVSNAELFAIVWPNTHIEESALRVHIAALRKALGDGQSGTRFIVSVRGRGYSFVAEVERIPGSGIVAGPFVPAAPIAQAVPVPLVGIIGRDEAVSDISGQLLRKRFVTITGTGGIGKTAVALAIAHKLASIFRDGVLLIDLGSLGNAPLVAAHLASLLRLPAPDAQPLQYAIAHLRNRGMLIVLDNCEHVVEPVSEIAEAILRGAPEVHILATSREPLRATGEWVRRLDPLAVPPISTELTAAEALCFPAVQLFAERTLACDGAWQLTDADAPVAAQICTRLDGLPLAIELAATRVPLFGLRDLADRLDDRFGFLTKGRRTALPRHQTLAAMIDWSYETLSDAEKVVWCRFSVFRGAFTIDAAIAIGVDRSTENFNIVDILESLVEKSLVSVNTRGGEARYRLLESLRLYTLNKLLENKEEEPVRRRHAQYWYERSADSAGNLMETPTDDWLSKHSGTIADVRAALEWAFAPGGDPVLGIEITAASAPLWYKMLLLPELRRHLEYAIQLAPKFMEIDDTLVMRMHVALANSIVNVLGSVSEVGKVLDEALVIAERRDDVNSQIQIIWTHWGTSCMHGDYAAMMPWLERVHRILVKSPELPVAPLYERMAALTYHLWGEQKIALRHVEQALQHLILAQRTQEGGPFVYDHKIATSSHYSRILWVSGRPDEAVEVIRDTIKKATTAHQSITFGFFLVFAACPISLWTGDLKAAHKYLSMLLDVQSGITFNAYQRAGRLYERVLDFLEEPDLKPPEARDKLVNDTSLTPFHADSLSTFDWRLLCPQPIAQAVDGELNWCTAEILRAKGEALLDAGNSAQSEVEKLFLRSIDISRRQAALSWELRSATSLARLWHLDGRTTQARTLLTEVYGRFTEGFATRDLVKAKTLLDAWR